MARAFVACVVAGGHHRLLSAQIQSILNYPPLTRPEPTTYTRAHSKGTPHWSWPKLTKFESLFTPVNGVAQHTPKD
eukprot:scaffold714_cov121-Isochrysis_galbana.AAC.26